MLLEPSKLIEIECFLYSLSVSFLPSLLSCTNFCQALFCPIPGLSAHSDTDGQLRGSARVRILTGEPPTNLANRFAAQKSLCLLLCFAMQTTEVTKSGLRCMNICFVIYFIYEMPIFFNMKGNVRIWISVTVKFPLKENNILKSPKGSLMT